MVSNQPPNQVLVPQTALGLVQALLAQWRSQPLTAALRRRPLEGATLQHVFIPEAPLTNQYLERLHPPSRQPLRLQYQALEPPLRQQAVTQILSLAALPLFSSPLGGHASQWQLTSVLAVDQAGQQGQYPPLAHPRHSFSWAIRSRTPSSLSPTLARLLRARQLLEVSSLGAGFGPECCTGGCLPLLVEKALLLGITCQLFQDVFPMPQILWFVCICMRYWQYLKKMFQTPKIFEQKYLRKKSQPLTFEHQPSQHVSYAFQGCKSSHTQKQVHPTVAPHAMSRAPHTDTYLLLYYNNNIFYNL